jgi:hypothetical protein
MNDSTVTVPWSTISAEVHEFAVEKGVSIYLDAVIEVARKAFPSSSLSVSLGRDAEDETHQYIAVDVEAGGQGTAELLAAQRTWSAGIGRVCPSRCAIYFVLGWR